MDIASLFSFPLGPLLLRPGFDRAAVPLLVRYYFPASRLWAMGLADPSGETLLAAAPSLRNKHRRLMGAIDAVQARGRAYAEAAARWEELLFGNAGVPPAALHATEDARTTAAQAMMASRRSFVAPARAARLAPFGWEIPSQADVAARHGTRLDGTRPAFPVDDEAPPFETSNVISGDGYETLWLRAPTRVAGEADTLWARVERPLAPPRAAVVFTHGIAMETEFWRCTSSLVTALAREGVLVVRPEGPWHGRRRRAGTFGGEPVLAPSPMGLLDYFEGHVPELGRLIRWARTQTGGPVAVGGVSLGALSAQMVVSAGRDWPAAYRPDAAFLVATAGSLMEVTMDGRLTGALGLPRMLEEGGWDREALSRWMPLLQPGAAPCMAPENVVAVLGTRDSITPFASGRALMERWDVPSANRFVRPLGHFTVSLGLYRDAAPLERLRAVLAA